MSVDGLSEERGLRFAFAPFGSTLQHPGHVEPAICLPECVDGQRTERVIPDQFSRLNKFIACPASIAELQPQLSRALQPARSVRIRRRLSERRVHGLKRWLELFGALVKFDRRGERLNVASRQHRNPKPRLCSSGQVLAFALVNLSKAALEGHFLVAVLRVHRLLFEHRRKFIKALLLFEQTDETFARLPIAPIDLNDQLPGFDGAIEILELALTNCGDIVELGFTGIARERRIAGSGHQHVAKIIEFTLLSERIFDVAERFRMRRARGENPPIKVQRPKSLFGIRGALRLFEQPRGPFESRHQRSRHQRNRYQRSRYQRSRYQRSRHRIRQHRSRFVFRGEFECRHGCASFLRHVAARARNQIGPIDLGEVRGTAQRFGIIIRQLHRPVITWRGLQRRHGVAHAVLAIVRFRELKHRVQGFEAVDRIHVPPRAEPLDM